MSSWKAGRGKQCPIPALSIHAHKTARSREEEKLDEFLREKKRDMGEEELLEEFSRDLLSDVMAYAQILGPSRKRRLGARQMFATSTLSFRPRAQKGEIGNYGETMKTKEEEGNKIICIFCFVFCSAVAGFPCGPA